MTCMYQLLCIINQLHTVKVTMAVYLLTANNKTDDTFYNQTSPLILMTQCCDKQNTPEKICSAEGLMALIM